MRKEDIKKFKSKDCRVTFCPFHNMNEDKNSKIKSEMYSTYNGTIKKSAKEIIKESKKEARELLDKLNLKLLLKFKNNDYIQLEKVKAELPKERKFLFQLNKHHSARKISKIKNSSFISQETSDKESLKKPKGHRGSSFKIDKTQIKRTYLRRISAISLSSEESIKSMKIKKKKKKKKTIKIIETDLGILNNLISASIEKRELNSPPTKTRNKQEKKMSGFKRRYIESQNLKTRPTSMLNQTRSIHPITGGDTTKYTDNIIDLRSMDKPFTPITNTWVLTPTDGSVTSMTKKSIKRSMSQNKVVFSSKTKDCSIKTHKILNGLSRIISTAKVKSRKDLCVRRWESEMERFNKLLEPEDKDKLVIDNLLS